MVINAIQMIMIKKTFRLLLLITLSSYHLDHSGRLIVGSEEQVESMGYKLHEKWAHRKGLPANRKNQPGVNLEWLYCHDGGSHTSVSHTR